MQDTEPIYEVVLRRIEADLRSGRLGIGDRLPAERALAEQFGISRASVREALRVLDAMGVVRSRRGTGPNSGAVVVAEPSAALGWALRLHVATTALPVRDIVEARMLLEARIARDALADADAERLAAVLDEAEALLDRMDDPELPADEFHALDAQFHIGLSQLSPNVVLSTMLASLREATIEYVREGSARVDWPPVRDALQRQHRGILAAARARDGELTARLLAEHIRWFFDTALGAGSSADA